MKFRLARWVAVIFIKACLHSKWISVSMRREALYDTRLPSFAQTHSMARIDRLSVIFSDALPQLRLHQDEMPGPAALQSLLRSAELKTQWSPEQLDCARLDPWQLGLLHALDIQSEPA